MASSSPSSPRAIEVLPAPEGEDSIGFAVELLAQEIKAPADRLVGVEERRGGGDMGVQPVELLGDIGLGGEDRGLLNQPFLGQRALGIEQRADLFLEAGLERRRLQGGVLARRPRQFSDFLQVFLNDFS